MQFAIDKQTQAYAWLLHRL